MSNHVQCILLHNKQKDILMNNHYQYKIPGIYNKTLAVLEGAKTTLESKRNVLDFIDADPTDIQVEILDYAASIDMLGEMIIEDVFVDEESFNAVYQLAQKYYIYTQDDYPGIRMLMKKYMALLDTHRLARFDG